MPPEEVSRERVDLDRPPRRLRQVVAHRAVLPLSREAQLGSRVVGRPARPEVTPVRAVVCPQQEVRVGRYRTWAEWVDKAILALRSHRLCPVNLCHSSLPVTNAR